MTPEQLQQTYRAATEALNRQQWQRAGQLGLQLLERAPQHAGVHFILGIAALEMRGMPQAIRHLGEAVRLNGQRSDYRAQLARALAAMQRQRDAVIEAGRAAALPEADAMTHTTLGVVFSQANQHENAEVQFAIAVRLAPDQATHHFNHGTALMAIGRIDDAEAAYARCLAIDAHFWKAWLARSQLRKQQASDNHIDALESLRGTLNPNDVEGRLYVNLALDKEYEDLGESATAFARLTEGKAAWRSRLNYSTERDERLFEALMATDSLAVSGDAGCDSSEPIFVIGMPRSGTTLVERILSSHPAVKSAGELQNFGVLLKRGSGSTTPPLIDVDTVQRAGGITWSKLGAAYIESTRPATGTTPHFIDKLPHNFLYAGYIARALPKAKIICLRRDPVDTCVANFRQLFALSSPYYDYSFDLLDTGRYFRLYQRLMQHWENLFPGRVFTIDYEAIVDDQRLATENLLAACGLPWDDACLHFEDNAAPVSTASAVQVRQPIYRSSVGRWKRYENETAALRELLAAAD